MQPVSVHNRRDQADESAVMLHTVQAESLLASVYWLAIKAQLIATLSRTCCSDRNGPEMEFGVPLVLIRGRVAEKLGNGGIGYQPCSSGRRPGHPDPGGLPDSRQG